MIELVDWVLTIAIGVVFAGERFYSVISPKKEQQDTWFNFGVAFMFTLNLIYLGICRFFW
jgi:hypothetical protein